MTEPTSKSDQRVLGLLAAAKKHPPSTADQPEASDYDWTSPCRFTFAQLSALGEFAERAGTEIAQTLNAQIHEEVKLQPNQLTQHYAERLSLSTDEVDRYYAHLATAEGK